MEEEELVGGFGTGLGSVGNEGWRFGWVLHECAMVE